MALRQPVSLETLQRAIKAKLATRYGLDNPCVVMPVRVTRADLAANGRNWKVDTDDLPDDARPMVLAAAGAVAESFNLN